jgi:hypothetical protein
MAITKSNKGYSTGVSAAGMGMGQAMPSYNNSSTPPSNPSFGDLWQDDTSGEIFVYTQNGWVDTTSKTAVAGNIPMASISNNGNLSVGKGQSYAFHTPPTSVISIETKVGRISIDIETGDLTIPQSIGREQAIREFWLGFQEHFQPTNKAKYEKEIEDLKREVASTKSSAVLMKQASEKEANKRVADKVRKKYGNEKFIMLKPDDLIRFLEEA